MTVVYQQKIWDLTIPETAFERLKKSNPSLEVTITELVDKHKHQLTVPIYQLEDYFYYRNTKKPPTK